MRLILMFNSPIRQENRKNPYSLFIKKSGENRFVILSEARRAQSKNLLLIKSILLRRTLRVLYV